MVTTRLQAYVNYFTFDSLHKQLQGYVVTPNQSYQSIDYLLLHGYGDHFFRYRKFIEYFVQAGKSVAGFDLTGFGRSEGERGYINDFQDFIQNYYDFMALPSIADGFSESSQFIGFSMGGNVTAQYLHQADLHNNAFLVSPMFKLRIPASENLNQIVDSLETLVPTLNIYSGIIPPTKLYQDEFVHGNLTPALARGILNNQGEEFISKLKLPNQILLIHADKDPICDVEGSRLMAEQNPNTNLQEWDMIRHEILELEPLKAFELINSN